MSFRFFRRIKILPGLTLNMSKSGPSLSFGPRGLKHTIGPRGNRTTVGLPGTGLSYSFNNRKKNKSQSRKKMEINDDQAQLETERNLLRAVIAFQSKKLDEALKFLNNTNNLIDGVWLTGMIHLLEGRWDKAVLYLERAIKDGKTLGETFDSNGISATLEYPITDELTVNIVPNHYSTLLVLAEACQEQGKNQKAIEHLEKFLESSPNDAIVAISYAEIALDSSNANLLSKALEIINRTTNEESFIWIILFMKGQLNSALERIPEAVLDYNKALKIKNLPDDNMILLRYNLALCYEKLGERQKYRRELSTVYAFDANFADVYQRLNKK